MKITIDNNELEFLIALRDAILKNDKYSRVFPGIKVGPSALEWERMIELAKRAKEVSPDDLPTA